MQPGMNEILDKKRRTFERLQVKIKQTHEASGMKSVKCVYEINNLKH